MHLNLRHSSSANAAVKVTLDGWPITLPAGRRSLASIRAYLERLAMEKQRILCSVSVDGQPVAGGRAGADDAAFNRVEATTLDPGQMPLQLLRSALAQTAEVKAHVAAAVTLVVINDAPSGREHWWTLAQALKQPLLALSLVPDLRRGSPPAGASMLQLRKWQLEQLGVIIEDVDQACQGEDPTALSNALERRVLPWLCALEATLELWLATFSPAPPSAAD
jgi:hypothetical protein